MTAPELRFVLDLHRRVAGVPETGFAWSPYSVASALGLTAAGAAGTTRDELVAALAPDRDLDRLAAALADGAALGQVPDAGAQLAVANTLWADLSLPLAPSYLEAVKSWPGGSARGADFRGDAEGSRREVNTDVEKATRGLIRELIAPGVVSRDTRAIVVNALWLRAAWTAPFPEGLTRPQPFDTPTGQVDVPTMRLTHRLPYASRDGWQLVSLPAGAGVAADVLLPDGDLADAEPRLDPPALDALLASAKAREVALELPRFRVEGQASLKEPLQDMGVRTLFTRDADLSGVTGGAARLAVDAAVHKAVLKVEESGLEGAAATAVLAVAVSAIVPPPRPVRVRVDHPFLVLVRHRDSGVLYFLARVTDPR